MAEYTDIPYLGPARWYRKDSSGKPVSTYKRYVAIHNTSNKNLASAEAEASYATRRPDQVSSHYYCDHNSLVQSLHTDWVAYHAGSNTGNTHAIAYEITGWNSFSRDRWLASVAWPLLARQIARDCRKHLIEARWLTVAEMKAGQLTGLVTHADMTLAWGGTHTDPGPNFPKDHLLALVQQELAGGSTAGDEMDPLQVAQINNVERYEQSTTAMNPKVKGLSDTVNHNIEQPNHAVIALAATRDGVKELLARPPVQPAPVDPVALAAALRPIVAEEVRRALREFGMGAAAAVGGADPAG